MEWANKYAFYGKMTCVAMLGSFINVQLMYPKTAPQVIQPIHFIVNRIIEIESLSQVTIREVNAKQ